MFPLFLSSFQYFIKYWVIVTRDVSIVYFQNLLWLHFLLRNYDMLSFSNDTHININVQIVSLLPISVCWWNLKRQMIKTGHPKSKLGILNWNIVYPNIRHFNLKSNWNIFLRFMSSFSFDLIFNHLGIFLPNFLQVYQQVILITYHRITCLSKMCKIAWIFSISWFGTHIQHRSTLERLYLTLKK